MEQLSEDERGTAVVTYSWSWEDVIWPTVAYGLGAPQDNNWHPCYDQNYCIDDITLALVTWQVKDGTVISKDEECVSCVSDCREYLGAEISEPCPEGGDECADENGGCAITCSPTAASNCYVDGVDLHDLCEAPEVGDQY